MSRPIRTGILMLNMGEPQTLLEIKGFLTKVFTDKDIMELPFQKILGPLLAKLRSPAVMRRYAAIDGKSPLYFYTREQGNRMVSLLDEIAPATAPHKAYVGFRYASPLCADALEEIRCDGVSRVVVFSQYAQYSCCTSGSSLNELSRHVTGSDSWLSSTLFKNEFSHSQSNAQLTDAANAVIGGNSSSGTASKSIAEKKNPFRHTLSSIAWSFIDRWPLNKGLIDAFVESINAELAKIGNSADKNSIVLLFSAHSLPLKMVARGDTYPSEVAATMHGVMSRLGYAYPYRLVWQSKVGPLPWLEPKTDNAMRALVKQSRNHAQVSGRSLHSDQVTAMVLVPISFVNEHTETLHELDIEYCSELACELGDSVKIYRAQAPNLNLNFIRGLADEVKNHLESGCIASPQLMMRCPFCVNPDCVLLREWISRCSKNIHMQQNV